MKISRQAELIGSWLNEKTQGSGATVKVLPNMRHMWQTIFDQPANGAPQILCCFSSATARGGFAQRNTQCREDREWAVVVMRGNGFKRNSIVQQKVAMAGVGFDTSFYDDCEAIRELLRRLVGISEEPIDYASMRPLPGVAQPNIANTFLDGYVITFTTANDIPEITMTDPGQE